MPNAPKRPNAPRKKSGKSKKRKRSANQGWSITKVATALAIAIALLGWAFAAAHYANFEEGWQSNGEIPVPEMAGTSVGNAALGIIAMAQSLTSFLWNSVTQVPDLPWVIAHVFRNAIWLAVIFILLEGLVILFVFYDRKLNREWNRTDRGGRPPE